MDIPIRLLSIDPGTMFTGIAVSEVDQDRSNFRVVHAQTLDLNKLARGVPEDYVLIHGDRRARLCMLTACITRLLAAWRPVSVVSESPYASGHIQAFEALVECLSAIGEGVRNYDDYMRLNTLEPSLVKKGVGVKGNTGDKLLMRTAIQNIPDLILDVNVDTLSEHAVDAIAVGYSHYNLSKKKGER